MKQPSNHFRIKTILIALFIQVTAVSVCIGQTKTDQIDKLMNLYSEYGQFNGSVLVADAGTVIYKKGFGMANMEWNIPNQSDTKHRLGSVTKQFTAVLIVQLAEQGKLTLDAPIATYLPNYPKASGDKITIHHLLTHASGIPNYTSFANFEKDLSINTYSPEAFLKVFADSPLEFTPGEKFAYSNSGYFLLGYILEKVSGKSYEQCLHDNILTPLKMSNTGYDHHETILKNRATGYEKNGKNYKNAAYLDLSIPYAAGSLYSTVDDLYLWDQALYTEQLLSKKYKDLLFNSYIPAGPGHYGYGWFINKAFTGEKKESLTIIEHGGGINGFNTLFSQIPSDKKLVVLLNNTGSTNLNEMNKAIRNILYNKPYSLPKKSLATALVDIIMEKGIASGLEYFKENKNSTVYAINENEMNNAGYQLLNTGKEKEAIEVFKLNVEAFPQSGNTYDSLGEAYLKNGDKNLAITNYKKSVELDPKNENGKKILKEISKS
ncbi:serine hydrolase [Flavobacterium sp. XS2P39]|uniref:serine hydrolase n=1 Tax=Flavobacterium sp. XS2P39 TaxID=3401725 RepID=UPI003AAFAF6B